MQSHFNINAYAVCFVRGMRTATRRTCGFAGRSEIPLIRAEHTAVALLFDTRCGLTRRHRPFERDADECAANKPEMTYQ